MTLFETPATADAAAEKNPLPPATPSPASFEAAMRELEGIVARMEDGSLSLEDSLVAYKRGTALVRHCQGELETARLQVQILDGEILRPATELLVEEGEQS